MKVKKYWFLGAIGISLIVSFSVRLFAVTRNEKNQLEEYGVSTLQGLKGVNPVISFESLSKVKEENKLGSLDTTYWKAEFQMEAEYALLRNGIKMHNANFPVLIIFIEANSMEITEKGYIYAFKVSTYLYEEVQLIRNTKLLTTTITWPDDPVIIVGRGVSIARQDKVKLTIKQQVIQQTNEFCREYLAANPKYPTRPKEERIK
ncbi:MAG: hypothetical protein ACXACF_10120 [Candidatus Hermodarchaeia archaeon]|jgi:hypothetical protein